MRVSDILEPDRVRPDLQLTSKKRVLETLSELLAAGDPAVSESATLDALFARERLGSTCLGHGVAVPHERVASVEETKGAFLRLDKALDFDSSDGQPVDLVFGLLVPEESGDEHVRILSELTRRLGNEEVRARIRSAGSARDIWDLLCRESAE